MASLGGAGPAWE